VHIDPDAVEYPFEQLAAIMRQRIKDGVYTSRIPPLTDLEAESGLSPMTVRRAVQLLVNEGLIETKPGRGTFVKK
jgi:DNA-binding GntR family transcriptional regulator